MHDPMTVLFRLGRLAVFHRDRGGVDGACDVRNGPYRCDDDCDMPPVPMPSWWTYCSEQERFLRDLRRSHRRRFLHVFHWRFGWARRSRRGSERQGRSRGVGA